MYLPGMRERVLVAGRPGVFLVVWIDRERQNVDLIALHDATGVEASVPFGDLEPFRDNVPLEST